jgi:hypothetical protein
LKYVVKSTGGGRALGGDFKGTNTGLGNVKGAITGTCRSIDIGHTPRYLAGYEWRFNRRFDLSKNLERLARFAVVAVRQRKAAGSTGVIRYTYGRNDLIFARDRNQKWLLSAVRREYRDRHFLIRSLVRVCGGRSRQTSLATSAPKLAADAATP